MSMPTADSVTAKLRNLTAAINEVTQKDSNDLTIALSELIQTKSSNGATNFIDYCKLKLENEDISLYECTNKEITAVTTHPAVTRIVSSTEEGVFENSGLKSVDLRPGLQVIGDRTFRGSSSINNISIPNTVSTIGKEAFSNCHSIRNITLPDSVVTVEQGAFEYCEAAEKVTIGANVETLGDSAFWQCNNIKETRINNLDNWFNVDVGLNATPFRSTGEVYVLRDSGGYLKLTELTIPTTVTAIKDHSFMSCPVEKVNFITASITSIGESSFQDCKQIKSLVFPNSLRTIGNGAFRGCSSVSNIDFSLNLNTIGLDAFQHCESLTTVQLGANLTSMNGNPFAGCNNITRMTVGSANTKYYSSNNCVLENTGTNVTTLVAACKTSVIPDNITQIGKSAIAYADWITEFQGQEQLTSVQDYAFEGCPNLEYASFSFNLNYIGFYAFKHCPKLQHIKFYGELDQWNAISKSTTWCDDNLIVETASGYCAPDSTVLDEITLTKDNLNLIEYTTDGIDNKEVTIPTSVTLDDKRYVVTELDSSLFANNSEITSVTVPRIVHTIGNSAFSGCTNLTSATVTNVGHSSIFSGCSNLKTVTITYTGVVGSGVFSGCSSLVNVAIPSGALTIGGSAFQDCSSLSEVSIPASVRNIYSSAFKNCTNLTRITFNGTMSQWQAISKTAGWDSNCSNYTVYCTDGELSDLLFTLNSAGTEYSVSGVVSDFSKNDITVPTTWMNKPVTAIAEYAFCDCQTIRNLTIPDSVTRIGESAFQGCCNLENIVIPDSVTNIGDYAFHSCTTLTSVTIPNSVTTIGEDAFADCTSLTSITIGDSVTSIGSGAFDGCSSLENINIPSSVTSIGNDAFSYCNSLINITIPDNVTNLGTNAFKYCEQLQTVTLLGNLTQIKSKTFYKCVSLESVILPSTVTSIGLAAFEGCFNLVSINIPESVTEIQTRSFVDCTNLTINYAGTVEQWNLVTKYYDWNKDVQLITVQCSDGVVKMYGLAAPEIYIEYGSN